MTISARQEVIEQLETLLKDISTANGYQTDFAQVRSWDDLPSQYGQNEIVFKDPRCKFEKKNNYTSTVRIEIIAIVLETATASASKLGNIALEDLIRAVSKLSVCKLMVTLVDSHKFIQTKGKTACEIELNIDVKYQF